MGERSKTEAKKNMVRKNKERQDSNHAPIAILRES